MDGQAEKIKSLVNILNSYLDQFKCFLFQVVKRAGWVSGWAEDVLLNNMKKKTLQRKDTDPREHKAKLDDRVQSRLLGDFYDAQKKEFELRNLSKDEISFLFEYVCTTYKYGQKDACFKK